VPSILAYFLDRSLVTAAPRRLHLLLPAPSPPFTTVFTRAPCFARLPYRALPLPGLACPRLVTCHCPWLRLPRATRGVTHTASLIRFCSWTLARERRQLRLYGTGCWLAAACDGERTRFHRFSLHFYAAYVFLAIFCTAVPPAATTPARAFWTVASPVMTATQQLSIVHLHTLHLTHNAHFYAHLRSDTGVTHTGRTAFVRSAHANWV